MAHTEDRQTRGWKKRGKWMRCAREAIRKGQVLKRVINAERAGEYRRGEIGYNRKHQKKQREEGRKGT